MRRFAAVLLAAAIALPAAAGYRNDPLFFTGEAREELRDLELLARSVRDPVMRAEMLSRIDRIDGLVGEAEQALDQPARPVGITMAEARGMVAAEAFDDDRVEVIGRLARSSSYTTMEARELASLCTFDSSKADALVALYPAVSDPGRFAMALDILTFGSTRRDVERRLGL